MIEVTRDQIVSYLNTTPKGSNKKWGIVGVGVTDYSIEYNPQTTTEKWIIHKNATTSLNSYQIQGDIEQVCHKGDEVFDYINELRRKEAIGSNAHSQVLDIDTYEGEDGNYKAIMHDCTVAVSSYGGSDTATIGYSIFYNGDGIEGVATISDGVVTFVPGA